ncbi:MAG: hypothetical protein LBR64_11050 [Dysgonamonadaceae bacterium]|jgi:hypothetical protein|nr:hypothetical protein [Dysgonamonadaceae bacterium]
MTVEQQFYYKKDNDFMESLRQAEEDFNAKHTPLYANYLFANGFVMSLIEDFLMNRRPDGTQISAIPVYKNFFEADDPDEITNNYDSSFDEEHNCLNALDEGGNEISYDNIRLHYGAISCGLEMTDGKPDYDATCKMAKYSKNVIIEALEAINEEPLFLVRDNSLSDNRFALKYISDNEDDNEPDFSGEPVCGDRKTAPIRNV